MGGKTGSRLGMFPSCVEGDVLMGLKGLQPLHSCSKYWGRDHSQLQGLCVSCLRDLLVGWLVKEMVSGN